MNVIGVLLAAGHSRRFGSQNKLMQPLHDGSIMALNSANSLISALPESIAVVRPEATELTVKLVNLGMDTIACADDEQLMSDSLAVGIRFATSLYPSSHGYIVALADMPFVQPKTIMAIEKKLLEGATIVAPRYQGQRGNPVGFSAKFTEDLMHLTGDQGARVLFEKYQLEIEYIETDDAGILMDIDTPDDLQKRVQVVSPSV